MNATKDERKTHRLLLVSAPAKGNEARNHGEEKRRSSLVAWRGIVRKIAKKGFLREVDVPSAFARRLTDPLFVSPPARVYSLGGVAKGPGGANRFSTLDFFGKQLNRTRFIVINDEKFREWASTFLEAKFRARNPSPDPHLAAAFTHYMHERNLHWSGCAEGRRQRTRRR